MTTELTATSVREYTTVQLNALRTMFTHNIGVIDKELEIREKKEVLNVTAIDTSAPKTVRINFGGSAGASAAKKKKIIRRSKPKITVAGAAAAAKAKSGESGRVVTIQDMKT